MAIKSLFLLPLMVIFLSGFSHNQKSTAVKISIVLQKLMAVWMI